VNRLFDDYCHMLLGLCVLKTLQQCAALCRALSKCGVWLVLQGLCYTHKRLSVPCTHIAGLCGVS
jgi:hypothetical protein